WRRQPSDRLELLEWLPAALAVAERPARRRTEEVLEPRVGRPAVRAPVHVRLHLHEARSRWREAGGAELLTPRRRDLVRRPRVVVHDLDLRLGAEAGHRVLERALHELERRAAEKRRRELHVDVSLLDVDRSDDAEVDERDDWDLRVGDPLERLPDLLRRHHCAPTGAERRTIVISSCRAANESSKTPRSTASTSSSPTRAESAARCSGRTTPSAYGHSSDTASRKRGSSCSRSCHISACIRWYASSR